MGVAGTVEIEGRTLVSMFGEDCILKSWPEPHQTVASSAHKEKKGSQRQPPHPPGKEKVERRSRGCLCWSGSGSSNSNRPGKLNVDSI